MMSTLSTENRRAQAGFTLVELAIVLVIIGLLIGGILKGQELIVSTRMTSTAAQIKGIETAMQSFQDTYGALPGDMQNSNTRLPNCATAGSVCVTGGNGDNIIQGALPGAARAVGDEGVQFEAHLVAADLLSGLNPQSNALATGTVNGLLGTPLGQGSFYFMTQNPTNGTPVGANQQMPLGHYLLVASNTTIANAADFENKGIRPNAAQKIDSKIDDSRPNTGSVVGANTTGIGVNAGCAAAGNGATYNSQSITNDCGLYIRMQQ